MFAWNIIDSMRNGGMDHRKRQKTGGGAKATPSTTLERGGRVPKVIPGEPLTRSQLPRKISNHEAHSTIKEPSPEDISVRSRLSLTQGREPLKQRGPGTHYEAGGSERGHRNKLR